MTAPASMTPMPASEDTLRLPRELGWLYLIAPLLAMPLFGHDLHAPTRLGLARGVLCMYLPFIAIPLGCHALYETAFPGWIARLRHRPVRFTAHAAATTLVAVIVGAAIWPVLDALLEPNHGTLGRFLLRSVVITWAFVLPALLVQELRARADRIERAERAQRQLALEAQLQALQARTNPHFFFNSINTVACLIPEDPVLAERTLERIAEIVRYALDSSPAREVALGRELAIVRDYLEVQAARFGARLRWSVDLRDRLRRVRAPRVRARRRRLPRQARPPRAARHRARARPPPARRPRRHRARPARAADQHADRRRRPRRAPAVRRPRGHAVLGQRPLHPVPRRRRRAPDPEPLAALAARLEPHGFMRVHRGELVNLARVRAVRANLAELDDGQHARVARRFAAAFRAALGG